ncbi:hypothetical protein ABZ348_07150 [Streptomyces sp. NPDC005963]|uniref:hypothetical protein n=1 Tax=Streptomyces sp. NPDC005963 TaxID=3156721 RepID=UPI0033EB0C48
MESAILILALLFVAFVALGVYATVKAVRVAKKGVERTVTQARRTVEDTTLRAKSYGQIGVAGELAQLRLKLRTSMRATQDALNAGVAEDASLSESISLFERLSVHGRELDDELKRLEREPDRATVSAKMPELRERMERITHSAESLRWAARDRARRFAEDDLDTLSSEIDMEAGALRHWSDAETPAASGSTSGAAESSWPTADGRTVANQSWSDVESESTAGEHSGQSGAGPAAQQPQAITARDPRQASYPWEKSARPETTN